MKIHLDLTSKIRSYHKYDPEKPAFGSGYISIIPSMEYNYDPTKQLVTIEYDINLEKINIIYVPYTTGKYEKEESYRLEFIIPKELKTDTLQPRLILYKPIQHRAFSPEYEIIHKTN
jgi:hypothetical protein